MHSSDSSQPVALAATSFLLAASATTVLVLLPAYLVLDLGLAPAALGALGAVIASTAALALAVGRWLTHRTPGRRVIVASGTCTAALSPVLVLHGTATGIAAASVVGAAALGTSRPAWRALSTASAAVRETDRSGALGVAAGVVTAGIITILGVELSRGIQAGTCISLIGLAVLLGAVDDCRAPLAPRRSATLVRARRALTTAPVRRQTGTAALAGFAFSGTWVALIAAAGAQGTPAAVVLATAGTGAGGALAAKALGRRAAAAVGDELGQAGRAVVSHAALVGAGCAALVVGLYAQSFR